MGKDDLSQLLGQRRANKDVDSSALIYILFLSCYFARRYQSSWHVENKLNVQIFFFHKNVSNAMWARLSSSSCKSNNFHNTLKRAAHIKIFVYIVSSCTQNVSSKTVKGISQHGKGMFP